jgi:UDP-glucose 4-epimerase
MNDVCRAIEHVATAPAAAVAGRIFNLGSGQALRVIDLTERIRDRCAAVLGFTPEIERPEPRPGESSPSLVYRVDELRGAGFTPRSALDDEIDETLRFCRAHFA